MSRFQFWKWNKNIDANNQPMQSTALSISLNKNSLITLNNLEQVKDYRLICSPQKLGQFSCFDCHYTTFHRIYVCMILVGAYNNWEFFVRADCLTSRLRSPWFPMNHRNIMHWRHIWNENMRSTSARPHSACIVVRLAALLKKVSFFCG